MSWLLGLLGAFLGFGLSEAHDFASAAFGFGICWTVGTVSRMREQLERTEEALAHAQLQLAQLSAAARPLPPAEPALPVPPRAAPAVLPPAPALPVAAGARDARAPRCAPRAPAPPAPPPPPAEPGWESRALAAVQAWFTEGNVPVKVGVLVLLRGVAAALRYAAAQGYFTFPIELRLALIALAARGGARLRLARARAPARLRPEPAGRRARRAAADRVRGLPAVRAAARRGGLRAGAGAGGGRRACSRCCSTRRRWRCWASSAATSRRCSISTGSGNHVALFSYYAVLNAAVFAHRVAAELARCSTSSASSSPSASARRGARSSTGPRTFASVEPFLVLFFVFYVAIGLLYVLRQASTARPGWTARWCSARRWSPSRCRRRCCATSASALAFSALVVALLYAGPGVRACAAREASACSPRPTARSRWASRRWRCRSPSARARTASLWALEGAGAAWLGLRQRRACPGWRGSRCSCSRAAPSASAWWSHRPGFPATETAAAQRPLPRRGHPRAERLHPQPAARSPPARARARPAAAAVGAGVVAGRRCARAGRGRTAPGPRGLQLSLPRRDAARRGRAARRSGLGAARARGGREHGPRAGPDAGPERHGGPALLRTLVGGLAGLRRRGAGSAVAAARTRRARPGLRAPGAAVDPGRSLGLQLQHEAHVTWHLGDGWRYAAWCSRSRR